MASIVLDVKDVTRQFYDENVSTYERNTVQLQRVRWMREFCGLISDGGKVVDVGCAFGRDVKTFCEWGYDVVGLDFSEKMIERAREYVSRGRFLVGDMREMDFGDESVDGVWAISSFLHLSKGDFEKVLGDVWLMLKDGGVLFVGTYLGEGEGVVADERYGGAGKYYAFYGEEELKGYLERAGFEILMFEAREAESYERARVVELIVKKVFPAANAAGC